MNHLKISGIKSPTLNVLESKYEIDRPKMMSIFHLETAVFAPNGAHRLRNDTSRISLFFVILLACRSISSINRFP